MYTQYQRNHGSVSFFSFILYRFQRPYYQSTITWETGNSTTLVSLSRAIYFLQQSNRLSAFFCIVDNSEAFPYIVIKDEFSSPVEKTPQFSYDRLYFIMRWKDISAGEKKKIRGLRYSQKAVKYYMLQCGVAHCERNAAVGFQIFLGLSVFSEQTTVK